MKIIGVTGSSGAGKTTVCSILKDKYLAYIIDSDKVAKTMSQKGNLYFESIVSYFGNDIVDEKGELKRKKLASIIYENDEKREQLNNLTFTYVVKEIKDTINSLKKEKLIVIDAPLLFESGLDKVCDVVIGVIADVDDKIKRICIRDKIDEEMAKKRLNIQKDNKYIEEKSDYIIYNNSKMKQLEKDVNEIVSTLDIDKI